MTYWRRSNYPASGHADVPTDVWREFQRLGESTLLGARLWQWRTRLLVFTAASDSSSA